MLRIGTAQIIVFVKCNPMAMQDEELSKEQLLLEVKRLRWQVEALKLEKADLELLLETSSSHADSLLEMLRQTSETLYQSNQKLIAEIMERQRTEATLKATQQELQSLLNAIASDKSDLEMMLETIMQHGDIVQDLLHEQSQHDPLTGLYNRRSMEKFLLKELERAQSEDLPLGIIISDIDYFKCFNDTFGHQAGDVVLQQMSRYLQSRLRKSDIVCRYGGEEFILIMPEINLEASKLRAEQLRAGVKHLDLEYLDQPLGEITLSAGVACFPEHGITSAQILQAADQALYSAKKQGRDRVVVADTPVALA
jgi:diguanylate cyclase (GGDEF)-like protein